MVNSVHVTEKKKKVFDCSDFLEIIAPYQNKWLNRQCACYFLKSGFLLWNTLQLCNYIGWGHGHCNELQSSVIKAFHFSV